MIFHLKNNLTINFFTDASRFESFEIKLTADSFLF